LIGATAADVRRPFVYHGFVQGLLAGAAAVAVAGLLTLWAGSELQALTSSYAFEFRVLFFTFWESLGVVAAAASLGLLGAWVAVGRELRRFSGSP